MNAFNSSSRNPNWLPQETRYLEIGDQYLVFLAQVTINVGDTMKSVADFHLNWVVFNHQLPPDFDKRVTRILGNLARFNHEFEALVMSAMQIRTILTLKTKILGDVNG